MRVRAYILVVLVVMAVCSMTCVTFGQEAGHAPGSNYSAPGGNNWQVGGTLNVQSGGVATVAAGATLGIGGGSAIKRVELRTLTFRTSAAYAEATVTGLAMNSDYYPAVEFKTDSGTPGLLKTTIPTTGTLRVTAATATTGTATVILFVK